MRKNRLYFAFAFIIITSLAVYSGAMAQPGAPVPVAYLPLVMGGAQQGQAIVADHGHTELGQIPAGWITTAKQKVVWIYGHTSHGSQLVSGAEYLSSSVSSPLYRLLSASLVPPGQANPLGLRLGDDGGWSWNETSFLQTARSRINAAINAGAIPAGSVGVFMWSWCGEMSWLSSASVQNYITMMGQLESEYPAIRFVYMTGHTDGTSGPGSVLMANNQAVRDYVRAHNKVLFDFADIESWLPDGTPYNGVPTDACPWCQSWCDSHPGACPAPEISCAHSHSLNCFLKGKAFWWLSARLAGWTGN